MGRHIGCGIGRGIGYFARRGFVGAFLAFVLGAARRAILTLAHETKVDAAPVQIDAADLHTQARAYAIAYARALAAQFLACLVEAEILAAKLGDVHQPLDVQGVERDEDAKARDRADHAAELLA
jgi:hypothetical protein